MRPSQRQSSQAIMQGQAAVMRVASEMLLRGHIPYWPIVDVGVDLVVDGVLRIQVKSTLRHSGYHGHEPGKTFCFTLATGQKIVKKQYVMGRARKFSSECDLVVLWAIEPNRFWIVPAAALDGRKTISFGDKPQWVPVDLAEARTLRQAGWTFDQLADKYQTSPKTIIRRLNGSYAEPKANYAGVMQYENRWDLIGGALATLTEANKIVEQPTTADTVESGKHAARV